MLRTGTIACARRCNNIRAGLFVGLPRRLFPLILGLIPACAITQSRDSQAPDRKYATSADEEPVPEIIGRIRVGANITLPPEMLQPLSESYTLLCIHEPEDWRNLCLHLEQPDWINQADLARGGVVGILADIGESASGDWPVHISSCRTQAGDGFVEADFTPGLYYPLKTAAYLELVFIPGLRSVSMVRVGQHTYRILSGPPPH